MKVLRSRPVQSIVVSVGLAALLGADVLAVGKDKAMYVRGTLSAIKKMTEGRFSTQTETELAFSAGKKGSVAIPYAAIVSVEFEQQERRVVMIGFGPPVSKRLASYLTIKYSDPEGKEQSVVFELGKGIIPATLKLVEARSGKTVTFQDAETCRQFKTAQECEGK
jgi:hypothetical protein